MCLPVLTVSLSGTWLFARNPGLLWWVPPTGFGVDWHCQENTVPSVRACIRR